MEKRTIVTFCIIAFVLLFGYGIITDLTAKTPAEIEAERRQKEEKLHEACMVVFDEIAHNTDENVKLTQFGRKGISYQLFNYELRPTATYPTKYVYGGHDGVGIDEQYGYRIEWESDGKYYSVVDFNCDGDWDYLSQGTNEGDKINFWTESKRMKSEDAIAMKDGIDDTVIELTKSSSELKVKKLSGIRCTDLKTLEARFD